MQNTTLNLYQKILQREELESLAEAMKLTSLHAIIKSGGPFTLFAPTSEAFKTVPRGLSDTIEHEIETMTRIMQYHIVPGVYLTTDLVQQRQISSLIREELYCAVHQKNLWINGAQLMSGDFMAENGVMHIIDYVLVPESLQQRIGGGEYGLFRASA